MSIMARSCAVVCLKIKEKKQINLSLPAVALKKTAVSPWNNVWRTNEGIDIYDMLSLPRSSSASD